MAASLAITLILSQASCLGNELLLRLAAIADENLHV